MKLRKQRYPWSCLTAAFAMVLDIEETFLHDLIGHDGGEIWWPEKREPFCRRSFHPQEILDAVFRGASDSLPVCVERTPWLGNRALDNDARFFKYVERHDGVLTGEVNKNRHAVAWNAARRMIFDPNGMTYKLEGFNPEHFFLVWNL